MRAQIEEELDGLFIFDTPLYFTANVVRYVYGEPLEPDDPRFLEVVEVLRDWVKAGKLRTATRWGGELWGKALDNPIG